MPEKNLVCFVLCISHCEFISSSWWFDTHRLKIFFVIGLQRRLLHAITANVTQIKISLSHLKFRLDSLCTYQKSSLTDLWLFCIGNLKKNFVVFYSNLIWTISLLLLYLRTGGNERDFDPLNGYQRLFNFLFVLRIKGAVSRQSTSFCLILPITRPQSLWNLK